MQGRDLASAIAEAQRKVDDPVTGAHLPKEGYTIKWSGEFEQMQEANGRLMWIIPLSLGLIMLLLYSMFGSVKDCMLVAINVLEAAMGGVGPLPDGHAVQHLGRGRVRLGLRRGRTGRRAAGRLP